MLKLVKPAGLLTGLLCLALLAGCAPSATQYAPLPEQLNAAPAPGKARVCVIRGYIFWIAAAVQDRILEDGQVRGDLINGSYICWERLPGVAQLALQSDYNLSYYRGNLPVEADLVYYLYLDALSPQLKSIPPAEGQKYLAEYPKPMVSGSAATQGNFYGKAPAGGAPSASAAPAGNQPVGAATTVQTIPPPGRVGY